MNIAKHLERSAFFFPDRPAVVEEGREVSYGELNQRAGGIALALLDQGVQPGDFIGLCAPNSADWLAVYFGVLKAGAVAVTLSFLLKEEELSLLVRHARPRFIYSTPEKLATLQELKAAGALEGIICPGGDGDVRNWLTRTDGSFRARERNRSDTAAILFTGGTTGLPKGVELSQENITVSSHNVSYSERSGETDRALCFLPFNHVFGQIHIMNATIFSGGCLELLPAFDLDRVLQILATGRITKFFAVPTVYLRLLTLDRLSERLAGVRYFFSAAASLAAEVVREWQERTGRPIYEGYGLTESAAAVTYNHYLRHRIGSVGETVPGVEVEIRDLEGRLVESGQVGEICIRGRNIMTGYLNNPEATASVFWEEGWFRSGDLGFLDPDGYLYIVDRLKELIITGGENVYPREVEEVLYARPEIQECAVIGLPDREWGERVVAFIVLNTGYSQAPEDLKSFLRARLSPYKVPKEIIVVRELPKSPAGKILKRALKSQLSG
jgi:long-chain acyl-CoA synthetase